MPNVTGVLVAPILGPHRRNQLSIALNATHHVNLLYGADNHAKRSCRQHQNFGKPIGSQNANQHGDPHSPPRPIIIVPLQLGKTESILRPLLLCGVNQWIGGARQPSCFSKDEARRIAVNIAKLTGVTEKQATRRAFPAGRISPKGDRDRAPHAFGSVDSVRPRLVSPPSTNACMVIYAPAHCPSLYSSVHACNTARRKRAPHYCLRRVERQ
jgi:hypothetical protein